MPAKGPGHRQRAWQVSEQQRSKIPFLRVFSRRRFAWRRRVATFLSYYITSRITPTTDIYACSSICREYVSFQCMIFCIFYDACGGSDVLDRWIPSSFPGCRGIEILNDNYLSPSMLGATIRCSVPGHRYWASLWSFTYMRAPVWRSSSFGSGSRSFSRWLSFTLFQFNAALSAALSALSG
jgi:hypothetical protein